MKTDVATYQFETRDDAWGFYRACEAAKIDVGFPGLRSDGLNTVQVALPTWMTREIADTLAKGAPVVAYKFADREVWS
jgi:hypothetical protein